MALIRGLSPPSGKRRSLAGASARPRIYGGRTVAMPTSVDCSSSRARTAVVVCVCVGIWIDIWVGVASILDTGAYDDR